MEMRKRVVYVRYYRDKPRADVEFMNQDALGYLCFLRSASPGVCISSAAMDIMRVDLSMDRETSGYLLGRSGGSARKTIFTEYVKAKGITKSASDIVEVDEEAFEEQMSEIKSSGFNSVIDMHNHPYSVKEIELRTPKPFMDVELQAMLRRGLFKKLQKVGGVSKMDRDCSREFSRRAINLGLTTYLFGVYATVCTTPRETSLGILMVHNARNMTDVPISLVEAEA